MDFVVQLLPSQAVMSAGRAKLGSRLETDRLFQVSDPSSSYHFYKVTGSRITTVTLSIELL